jgi:phosphate transport system substrate-binding protein
LNDNGKLDSDENFYANIDPLIAAILAGKYPSSPTRDLYFGTVGN